ncbi:MAG: CBS domain-containing protein [Halanaerobiales bacterium]|nr:CBS domain-containing protein [Halanaerobiales bacterium]
MRARDIMTSEVKSLNPNSTVRDAAQIMKELNVGSVPVLEGNKPVGMITDRDIAIRNVANAGDVNTPVSQVMTGDVVFATPEMAEHEVARLMAENQIRRLPVVDNGSMVGIIALGDLAVNSRSDLEAGKALSTISVPSEPKR